MKTTKKDECSYSVSNAIRTLAMVGATGFEPATFWSRTKRATKLRYAPGSGANEGTRTPDLLITNQLLYRLSYVGSWQKTKIAPTIIIA
jgi:hypothetical protein